MKLFVISDIHGFYDEMIEALDRAGFERDNPNHCLICCGDYFDRGEKPKEVMNYLHMLPRRVLIKGNHEELLMDCLDRGEFLIHDLQNGTYRTVEILGGENSFLTFSEKCAMIEPKIDLFFRQMVNYYETKNYIFVHCWIPLINEDNLPKYYVKDRKFRFNPNWRNATQKEWNEAMWGNPFELAKNFLPNKTIVFGHWHCSAGWAEKEGRSEFEEDAKFDIFHGNGFIGIDACTARTHKVNCLVIEDDLLYNIHD